MKKNSVCSQSYLYASFDSKVECVNFVKYLKTKFFRALVLVLKITQSAPNKVYRYVPIQNFKISENNDIDWSKSIEDINLQLYKKYGLDDTDVSFIEKMIKPMN